MKFNGFDEALALLQSLSSGEQKKILEGIKVHQPDLATRLENSLITLEDLRFLTPHQLAEFIRDIDLAELGYALRSASEELKAHLFQLMTTNLQKEVEETLIGAPVALSKVDECRNRIMDIVRYKVDKGLLVLDSSSGKLV